MSLHDKAPTTHISFIVFCIAFSVARISFRNNLKLNVIFRSISWFNMFPRRVPSLNTQLEIHSTGLTDPQMIALMALVNQILPDFVYHSRKITVVYVCM